jgi:hypothetical protein
VRVHRLAPPDAAERYFLALLREPRPPLPAAADEACWARVLDLARAHRLSEFLHARRDEAVRGDWPAAARGVLRERYIETSLRNGRFRAELARVTAALRARGIVPVLLKGGALTLTVYGDPGERPYGDLDLLIRRDELEAADDVMKELGFTLDDSWQPEAFYLAHHYHLVYRHAQRHWLCFELHWDLSLASMDTTFDAAGLRERALPVALDDATLLVPCPADELLHLALHTGLNGFAYLGQLRDVATLAELAPARLDPASLWPRARDAAIATPLALSLRLARLFGGDGPQRLLAAAPRQAGRGLLARLLRPEIVLRQRTQHLVAASETVALLRRDHWTGRLACLRRMVLPRAADLGMEGHPATAESGLSLLSAGRYGPAAPLRAGVWILLSLAGWDVEPRSAGDPREPCLPYHSDSPEKYSARTP